MTHILHSILAHARLKALFLSYFLYILGYWLMKSEVQRCNCNKSHGLRMVCPIFLLETKLQITNLLRECWWFGHMKNKVGSSKGFGPCAKLSFSLGETTTSSKENEFILMVCLLYHNRGCDVSDSQV